MFKINTEQMKEITKKAADNVMRRLTKEDITYASDCARGEFQGFAALHDLCDANMLLPNAVACDVNIANAVMDEVSRRIIRSRNLLVDILDNNNLTTMEIAILKSFLDDKSNWQEIMEAIKRKYPSARQQGYNWMTPRGVIQGLINKHLVARTNDVHVEEYTLL